MKPVNKIKTLFGVFTLLLALVLLLSFKGESKAQAAAFLISPYYGNESINQGYHGGHPAYDYSLTYQPVLAAASGTVTRVQWYNNTPECHQSPSNTACGYGLHIYIRHNNNYVSRYAHLSSTAFNLNTTSAPVNDGVVIGTSGHTGWSTGPHLHFEVKDASGGNANPYALNLWKDGQAAGHPLPPLASGTEIIVDDNTTNSAGFSKGRGGIFNNNCPPNTCPYWYHYTGIGYGNDMYATFVNGNVVDYWARWQPSLPSGGGIYEVFVHTPGDHATSWQAPFTVVHADGQTIGRVDQYGLFNRWVTIGVYRMVPGNYVYTTDATGESQGIHCGGGQWCELGADAVKFVRRDTLYQSLWRGNQGWSNSVAIINNLPQWGTGTGWLGTTSLDYLPGSGALQTQTYFVIGNTLWQGMWRGNQGWSRTIPLHNGQIRWGSASSWSGPAPISGLPGSGTLQTQSEFVVCNTLWQALWRGNQGWARTIPIQGGQPVWGSASAWTGPISISGLPGSGNMETQTEFAVGNTLWQAFWRGGQGWTRTVPINNCNLNWNGASAWTGPVSINGLPGSGSMQTQEDFVIKP